MLMKLTPVLSIIGELTPLVDFTNIMQAAFVSISLCKKLQKNFDKTFVEKKLLVLCRSNSHL
jgi:hypothetical protein